MNKGAGLHSSTDFSADEMLGPRGVRLAHLPAQLPLLSSHPAIIIVSLAAAVCAYTIMICIANKSCGYRASGRAAQQTADPEGAAAGDCADTAQGACRAADCCACTLWRCQMEGAHKGGACLHCWHMVAPLTHVRNSVPPTCCPCLQKPAARRRLWLWWLPTGE